MATLVATPAVLPSLDRALVIQSFERSQRLYNDLRDDAQQPVVEEKHIQNLASLFVQHNAHKLLGIHLIHGHFKIPDDTVLLGSNFEEPRGRWAKVTPIEEIDRSTVHGHIFGVGEDGLCAYEYQESPLPDFSSVGRGFLIDFVDYLTKHCITGLIGLQVLGECNNQSMSDSAPNSPDQKLDY
ncbi:hypothetical protein EDB80DRAFT_736869 [Ilyonectria destructans]|nr:hypothetical protein EDB80DRAFT_736869 [Ilyonectria destructans]